VEALKSELRKLHAGDQVRKLHAGGDQVKNCILGETRLKKLDAGDHVGGHNCFLGTWLRNWRMEIMLG
jgi:hypothetical protein